MQSVAFLTALRRYTAGYWQEVAYMNVELRAKLNEAVDAALATWKKRGLPKFHKGVATPKSGVGTPDSESETLIRWLSGLVRRNLWRQTLWREVQKGLVDDALARILAGTLRRLGPSPEPAQLPLPGFEHVPRSLGSGKYRVRLPEVPIVRFLKFESRYQARAERNKQTAEELRRIAEMVRPYEETDPSMPLAEAMEKAQAASVVVMTPRKAKR